MSHGDTEQEFCILIHKVSTLETFLALGLAGPLFALLLA